MWRNKNKNNNNNNVLSMFSLLISAAVVVSVHGWTSAPVPTSVKPRSCSTTTTLCMAQRDHQQNHHHQRSLSLAHQSQRREFLGATASATASVFALVPPSVASYIDPVTDPPTVTKRVYLDVAFGDNQGGRLVIGLFGDLMPRTAQNFETLCFSNSYAGTNFYRVISGLNVQGGAVGDSTGKTGRSSLEGGGPFEPDNFNLKHTKKGLVSMVRGIGGSVDSRFFVNTQDEAGWADDRYAAFGIVEQGMDIVKAIEQVPVSPPKNAPKNPVKIIASGVLSSGSSSDSSSSI